MDVIYNMNKVISKYEAKMDRKSKQLLLKKVRDKQLRIDRRLKAIWSE
jgi:hypothetical protein